ncbi:hypothetical protein SLEP1_g4724 [Rubroshorea leprosula]|uniref:Uncharacterized protein n=1 Tax=Rubroshorea leprosula TaxID=152421 RepID=A0AAV5HPM7_9ROSI|nr:hypothetical protein SLEP1_g4724 [Rubroshorea leprosula]
MVRTKRVVKKARGQAASTSGRRRRAEQSLEDSGESTDMEQIDTRTSVWNSHHITYGKCGCCLRGMESRDLHSHELLNESSLSKMGYVFSARTNSWEMKQKKRRGGQDDEGEGFDDEEHAEETEEAAKIDDHIRDCQMAAPIGPRGTKGDPSTAGTSSGQQPTDPFSNLEA